MKRMGKRLILLSSVLVAAGLIVGCSSNKENDSKKGSSETTELTIYMPGDKPKDFDLVMEEVNHYLEDKIDATLDLKMISFGDYDKKMQVVTSSGEKFDIAYAGSNYVADANKGAYMDLTDYTTTTLKEAVDGLASGYVEGASIDGKLMALPVNGAIASAEYWVFNKNYVDDYQLNLDGIQSLESLDPVLKQFHDQNQDVVALAASANAKVNIPYDTIVDGVGVNLTENTDKIVNLYDTPEMLEKLKTMHDYYNAGYIMKDAATAVDDPFGLKKGNDNWMVSQRTSGFDGTSGIEEITGFPVEAIRLSDKGIKTTSSAQVALYGVSSSSKNQEKAMAFLNLLNTDPVLANLMATGVEGVHYEKNDDGSITMLDRKSDYIMPGWALTDFRLLYSTKVQSPEKKAEQQAFIDDAITSPALGFSVDTKPIRTEIASISVVLDQYEDSLHTGTVEPEKTLKEMNEELEKAGMSKVVDEIQNQYTEWQKTVK